MPILGDNGRPLGVDNLFHGGQSPTDPVQGGANQDPRVLLQRILADFYRRYPQLNPQRPQRPPNPLPQDLGGLSATPPPPGSVPDVSGVLAGPINAARARAFNGYGTPGSPGVHPDFLANLQAMLHLPGLVPHPAGNPGDQPRPISPPIVAPQNGGPDRGGPPLLRPPGLGPVDRPPAPVGGSNPPSSPPSLGFGAPDQIQAPKPQRSFPPAPTTTPKMGGSGPLGSF